MITNNRVLFLLDRATAVMSQLALVQNTIVHGPTAIDTGWVISTNHLIAHMVAIDELLVLEGKQTERSSNYSRVNTVIKNIENQEGNGVTLASFVFSFKKMVADYPELIEKCLSSEEDDIDDLKDLFQYKVDLLQGYLIFLHRKTSLDTYHPLESELIDGFKGELKYSLDNLEYVQPEPVTSSEPVRTIGDLIRQQIDIDTLKYIHRPEDPKRFEWDIQQALSSLESLVQRMKSASGIVDNQSMTDIHMQMQGVVADLNHVVAYTGCVVQATGYPYKIVHEVPDPLGMDEDFDDDDFGDNQDLG